MTVVTIEDYDTTVAKYDRFATRNIPKRGKIGTAIRGAKFGFKVAARWASTPGGKRAIAYWATHSKYTKYGYVAISGGIIAGALQTLPSERNPFGKTRSNLVYSKSKFRNNAFRNKPGHCCITTK